MPDTVTYRAYTVTIFYINRSFLCIYSDASLILSLYVKRVVYKSLFNVHYQNKL